MLNIQARNINDAYNKFLTEFDEMRRGQELIVTESRNGKVFQFPGVSVISYTHPNERVLFHSGRRCNPFFHLFEAFWMLSGSNEVSTLLPFNKRMIEYSDDGITLNGAYGHRWLHHDARGNSAIDQLGLLINHLRANPLSRRAVLQMWNVNDDLMKISTKSEFEIKDDFEGWNDYSGPSKDVCCNLSVVFSVREKTDTKILKETYPSYQEALKAALAIGWSKETIRRKDASSDNFDKNNRYYLCNLNVKIKELDMTVFNRSNDAIWGALGANHVHFSYLQEYVAAMCGFKLGTYYQVSSNLHVYEALLKEKPRAFEIENLSIYNNPEFKTTTAPIINNGEPLSHSWFKRAVRKAINYISGKQDFGLHVINDYSVLSDVLVPMSMTWLNRKSDTTYGQLHKVLASDWRETGFEYLNFIGKKNESSTN